ncbi:hypothetical protein NB311A_21311 [Nitrobacter sp. Nb-311A]|nr:hypothetical protein NB311A_21311 [Nitrobacter sp. Nb-311A]
MIVTYDDKKRRVGNDHTLCSKADHSIGAGQLRKEKETPRPKRHVMRRLIMLLVELRHLIFARRWT